VREGASVVVFWYRFVKFAFRRFYNEFAWTYDLVSRIVSRGKWHAWQKAALPELRGDRVLEVAFGTGNLLWDMTVEGYRCAGIDLSPYMARIAAKKFCRQGGVAPVCRARAKELPFPDMAFDSLVVTFPDYFILDLLAQEEMGRVLVPGGRLVIVDGGHILKKDAWSRLLNWAFRITVSPEARREAQKSFNHPRFAIERREVLDGWSSVGVVVAVKK
jgi:ubiquinone/menaquinone biosynthesis C-methylase UbiE